METTVDLEPEAYRKAEVLAAERGQSIGQVLGDALLGRREALIETDTEGWPIIRTERPITSEQVKEWLAEDEEWEITRGDPNHPWYSVPESFEPGYPRVVRGPQGLPVVQLRPSLESAKGRG